MTTHCGQMIPNEILMHWEATRDRKGNIESEGIFFINIRSKYNITIAYN